MTTVENDAPRTPGARAQAAMSKQSDTRDENMPGNEAR